MTTQQKINLVLKKDNFLTKAEKREILKNTILETLIFTFLGCSIVFYSFLVFTY